MTTQPNEVPQYAVITGPIVGEFTLADGTVYDVTSDAGVPVANQEHADELMYLIGLHHEKHGHPRHDRKKPFQLDRSDRKIKKFSGDKSYKVHADNRQLHDTEES